MTDTTYAPTFVPNAPLPVTGTHNFRDLGGIPLRRGGVVASGQVFRSDAFHLVAEAGRAHMAELGITRMVDLRHDGELADMPSAVGRDAVEVLHMPVFAAAEAQGIDVVGITTASPAPLIEALLHRLDEEFDGAVAYLEAHGFGPVQLKALRERLTA
ncbi:tyrosine-protein phosphatase [Brevibacterium litoralis]|uniref:tyrosine-protein phosphatase n=1 Tax=Brevibacterium litoralis TaxID=3138935 RepID=UPI0032EC0F11